MHTYLKCVFSVNTYEMLFEVWCTSLVIMVNGSELFECVNHFGYLRSLVSSDMSVPDEIPA